MKNKIITLKNCNLYNGTFDMELQKGVNIEITNNVITNIGNFLINPKSKIIDLEGKYVVPGLINLHTHIPNSGIVRKKKLGDLIKLVNLLTKNKLTQQIGLTICKPQLKQSLYSGTTTIRTVGGLVDFDSRLRNKINNGKLLGPRMFVSDFAIGVPGGHMVGTVTKPIESKEEAFKLIEKLNKQKVDLVKIMITGGVLDGTEPGTPGQLHMKEELVKACCDKAHELGFKVAAHVEGTEGMNIAIKNGVDSIEHSCLFDESLAEFFKNRNGAIVITLSPAIPFVDLPVEVSGYGEMGKINSKIVFNGMLESFKLCQKYGIRVGLGTDAGSTFVTHYNFYRELILMKNYCNISNKYALFLGTLSNATILGMHDKIGSVEVGKLADLLIIENDPIEDLWNLGKPKMVVINGRVLKNPKVKHVKTVDEVIKNINWENK